MSAVELTLLCHGWTEAQRVGRFHRADDPLSRRPPARVWPPGLQCLVAPERRARDTAQALGIHASVEPALRDCELGQWHGLTLKHLQSHATADLQTWLDDPHAAPHGGESLAQLHERVGHWLAQGLVPGQWLAVTHPWVMRMALQHVVGGSLAGAHRIDVLPLGELRLSGYGGWRLRVG
ncbi:histidine phosphatase family protein [Pseudomonas sp. RP23018S]|uniref:histidine phosphatase family protein n=1 Tax=Pseudomonas sp. RP23018S TaxID=3096037 RepID=UPI002ACA686C|nr:histidine phosphatase family protein [Pseudomonas sp. RP23018S]MDZ5602781.1 histidine phosphatase family protein [Pseudomonas sp. RP23018S]